MVETITWWLVEAFTLTIESFWAAEMIAYAVVLTASSVISKALLTPTGMQQAPDPGSRQTLPPAGNNKIGRAHV